MQYKPTMSGLTRRLGERASGGSSSSKRQESDKEVLISRRRSMLKSVNCSGGISNFRIWNHVLYQ